MDCISIADQPIDLRVRFALSWVNYPRQSHFQPIVVPAPRALSNWKIAPDPHLSNSVVKPIALYPSPPSRSPRVPHASPISVDTNENQSKWNQDREDCCLSDDTEYKKYKEDAIHSVIERNGSLVSHNPRMRRSVRSDKDPDESYRAQRERNNQAAKQSRDRRRLREFDSALQVQFLKKKLAEVKTLLAAHECVQCRGPLR